MKCELCVDLQVLNSRYSWFTLTKVVTSCMVIQFLGLLLCYVVCQPWFCVSYNDWERRSSFWKLCVNSSKEGVDPPFTIFEPNNELQS